MKHRYFAKRTSGLPMCIIALTLILNACSGGGGSADNDIPADDDINIGRSLDNFVFLQDPTFVAQSPSFSDRVTDEFEPGLEAFNTIDNIFGGATVPVTYGDCGFANAFYSPAQRSVQLCHELTEAVFNVYFQQQSDELSEDAQFGNALGQAFSSMVFTMYHEAGHAVDDLVTVGSGGNTESIADAIGVVFSVESGQPLSSIYGGIFFASVGSSAGSASIHGNGVDRFFDIICWTIGSSSRLAALLPDIADTLANRGRDCVAEYSNNFAFVESLIPDLRALPPASSLKGSEEYDPVEMAFLNHRIVRMMNDHVSE